MLGGPRKTCVVSQEINVPSKIIKAFQSPKIVRFGGKGKNSCGLQTSRNGDLRAQRDCTAVAPMEPAAKLPDNKAYSKPLPTSFQTDCISIIPYHHIAIQAELLKWN